MNTNKKIHYNKYSLKFQLKNGSDPYVNTNFNIIANILKQENKKIPKKMFYTKEELYLAGFNAFQIHRYFKLNENNLWQLKNLIIINDIIIDNINELCEILKLDFYKIAC